MGLFDDWASGATIGNVSDPAVATNYDWGRAAEIGMIDESGAVGRSGGFLSDGIQLLGTVADKWLAFEDTKRRVDMEERLNTYGATPWATNGGGVPGWVWVAGLAAVVGVGFLMARRR